MHRAQGFVVAAVGVLVVLGVAALALRATGEPATAEPSGSGAPTPPIGSASAPPSGDAIHAELEAIEEQVAAIRGLPPADIGPAEIITRADLAAELEAIFAAEYPPEERERDNVVLRALGLIGPEDDIAELQLGLLGDQVLGLYDKRTRRMVVVSDAGLDAEAKLTYAHEYTHALQDAAFGLAEFQERVEDDDDQSLARLALIEGDATMTMLAWALDGNLTVEELLAASGAGVPDLGDAPSWMLDQLLFPYLTGQAWVTGIAGDPLDPDFAPIDALYADPPDSTEQVIDAEAWQAREPPLPVPELQLTGALGRGWVEVEDTTVGQATVTIILDYFDVTAVDPAEAAAGWGGDRLVVATGPEDAFAVAWQLAWDTPADATEFLAAYEEVVAALPFPAEARQLADGRVLVVHASDPALLAAIGDAAD